MEQQEILKQMIGYNKSAFDNTFNALSIFQEQMENMANIALDQFTWIPEEGKKAINEWSKIYKKGRVDLKSSLDENFSKAADLFNIPK